MIVNDTMKKFKEILKEIEAKRADFKADMAELKVPKEEWRAKIAELLEVFDKERRHWLNETKHPLIKQVKKSLEQADQYMDE